MIGASLAVIWCIGAIILMLLFVRGVIKMMKDPISTEDDRWLGGAALFGLSILIGLHAMLVYALTVGVLLK